MEIVSLIAADGTTVSIEDPLVLLHADWGDADVVASLATGPDIRGGIVTTRTHPTREVTLEIGVNERSGTDYVATTNLLDTVIAKLQATKGGIIRRSQHFRDGDSEQLELEVLEVHPAHDAGPILHKGYQAAAYTFTCLPAWLGAEELVAYRLGQQQSLTEIGLNGMRGNLSGPGRIVIADADSTARRFAEIGGAFTQDATGLQYEFLSADFDISGTDASSVSDSGAIGGNALEITGLLVPWRPVGLLTDLPHNGSFRVRLRGKGGSDDASAIYRVAWRTEGGVWQALDPVTVPDDANYWDLDGGSIHHYGLGEGIEVRADVRGSADDVAATARLNGLTILPSELYCVAEGEMVESGESSVIAYDPFEQTSGNLTGKSPAIGSAWTVVTSSDSDDFTIDTANDRAIRSAFSDTNLNTGRYVSIGTASYAGVVVQVDAYTQYIITTNNTWRGGVFCRLVDINNWFLVVRQSANVGTAASRVRVYKRVGGTVTQLGSYDDTESEAVKKTVRGVVDTAGHWFAYCSASGSSLGEPILSGQDDVLATGGALDDGKVGIYEAYTPSGGGARYFDNFRAEEVGSLLNLAVVRDGGIGVLAHDTSYSADTDGSAPLPFTPQGSRIWLPSGDGRLLAKVRSSNSEEEPDAGFDLATDYSVYRRSAWATIADALEGAEGSESLSLWRLNDAGDPPFDPNDIAGLVSWWEANRLSLSDNDPVSSWTDASPNGHDADQADSGKQPVFKDAILNGEPGILFDGTDDLLVPDSMPSLVHNLSTGLTFFFVVQPESGTDTFSALLTQNASTGFWWKADTNKLSCYFGADALNSTAIAEGTARSYALRAQPSGGNSTFYLNGTADGTVSPTIAFTPNRMGDDNSSETFKGYIFLAAVFDEALSDGDLATIHTYISDTYGL